MTDLDVTALDAWIAGDWPEPERDLWPLLDDDEPQKDEEA